jgi:uncharacterized repeat protein (TIGR01451 family)
MRRRTGWRGLLVVCGAFLCLIAAPAVALAANSTAATPTPVVVAPTASPACSAPPCNDPPAAQLTLTQTVDKTTAAVGDTVIYTITLGNTGLMPATAVTVDDVMSGTAGYGVRDGTANTVNTFVGQPVTTIMRLLTGHYRWTYAAVNPGDIDVVSFSAVITAPRASPPAGVTAITLTSTASTAGIAPAVVSTTAPFTAPPRAAGGVRGARTSVPPTGSSLNLAIAGFLLLGGLGFMLLGLHAYRRDEHEF